MRRRTYAGAAVLLLLTMSLSGCVFWADEESPTPIEDSPYTSIWERHTLEWQMDDSMSFLLNPGPYQALEVAEAYIEVDTSDVWETGPSQSTVHLSYWLPNNTLDGDQVPVIAIISPYFDYGAQGSESSPTNVVSAGRGEFIFQNFVPHGYAMAQVAVFGTEESSGCFDYRGAGEGLGIHSAVEWLGSQNWSNGNVGLYGKSYEGATQWEAAAIGSEYLKTIVPVSGTTALHPLLYKNGSAEARSQIMHMNYFSSTVDYNEDDFDNICPDIVEGIFAGPVTYIAGEMDPYMENYYDERSHIDKAFLNWNGSVYWVQGMQDWNVDPHQVFGGPPGTNWYQSYIDAGFEIRGMLGQWGHHYPDQINSHEGVDPGYGYEALVNMTRWDWAQDLFEWFEYYLQERWPKPDLNVQVQRHDGAWRIEDTYPSQDSEKIILENFTASCKSLVGNWWPLVFNCPVDETAFVNLTHPGFDYDVNISGMPTLELDVTASGDFGQVFATLYDDTENVRLGHATMDIRYNEGGEDPSGVVVSGQSVTMQMEFFAIDAFLPAGHELRIDLTGSGKDYLPPPCPPVGLCTVDYQSAKLTLPISNTPEEHYFNVPYWNPIEE